MGLAKHWRGGWIRDSDAETATGRVGSPPNENDPAVGAEGCER